MKDKKNVKHLKKQDIPTKREELINSIKDLIVTMDTIAKADGIQLHYLKNKEILDLNQETVSEDDFLEASIVYLEVAKNLIGEYLEIKGL